MKRQMLAIIVCVIFMSIPQTSLAQEADVDGVVDVDCTAHNEDFIFDDFSKDVDADSDSFWSMDAGLVMNDEDAVVEADDFIPDDETDPYIAVIQDYFKQYGSAEDMENISGLRFFKESIMKIPGNTVKYFTNDMYGFVLDSETKTILIIYTLGDNTPIFVSGSDDPTALINSLDSTFLKKDYELKSEVLPDNNVSLNYYQLNNDKELSGRSVGVFLNSNKQATYIMFNSLPSYSNPEPKPPPVPAPQNVKGKSTGYNSVKLSWESEPRASAYQIEISENNKDFEYFAIFENPNMTSCELLHPLAIKLGMKMYYRVCAIDFSNSFYFPDPIPSKSVAITPVTAAPKNLKVRHSGDSNVLTWNKTMGTNGYYIYRSTTRSGNYRKIATINDNTVRKYVDHSVPKGFDIYYKIIPYRQMARRKIRGTATRAVRAPIHLPDGVTGTPIQIEPSSVTVTDESIIGSAMTVTNKNKDTFITIPSNMFIPAYSLSGEALELHVGRDTILGHKLIVWSDTIVTGKPARVNALHAILLVKY